MVKNSINASYDDDFDDPFAPSDDSTNSVPTHDDWTGPPWTEEPYDYDDPFDHHDGYNAEVLPVERMPDITPEEMEICKELRCTSGNNCNAATDSNTSSTDAKDVDIDDDDEALFDGSYIPDDNDVIEYDQSTNQKAKLPNYIKVEKRKDGSEDKSVIRYKLADCVIADHHMIIAHNPAYNAQLFYVYSNGKYVEMPDNDVKRMIADYIIKADPSLINTYDVHEVYEIIKLKAPKINLTQLNNNENLINFANGLLDVKTGKLMPHTPDVYSTIQIPCNYVPIIGVDICKNAPVFANYISTLCNNNKDIINLLCQFLAITLSNIQGSRFKKAMVLYGDGNTGKSKIIELIQYIIGTDNFAICDITDLEQRFRTSSLFQKRLAGSPDMSYAKISELKIFKSATGGDQIFAERKGRDGFAFKYDGLFLFATNCLPNFGGDRGSWVYDRFIIINCNNVIPPEKQDKQLIDKLISERETITAYLVSKLPDIIKNGYKLNVPAECDASLKDFMIQNSSVLQFYTQFCEIRSDRPSCRDKATGKSIYDAYVTWLKSTNASKYVASYKDFISEIANYINFKTDEMMIRTSFGRYLKITAKPEFVINGTINITY